MEGGGGKRERERGGGVNEIRYLSVFTQWACQLETLPSFKSYLPCYYESFEAREITDLIT